MDRVPLYFAFFNEIGIIAQLSRAAFEALRTSPLLANVDGVICSHPAALCEVWLPFNKSMLLLVTTNLELARENPERWESWLRNLVAIAAAPRTVASRLRPLSYLRSYYPLQDILVPPHSG